MKSRQSVKEKVLRRGSEWEKLEHGRKWYGRTMSHKAKDTSVRGETKALDRKKERERKIQDRYMKENRKKKRLYTRKPDLCLLNPRT